MVLIKVRTIKKAEEGVKPNKFRFKKNLRIGFKNNKVVEIVEFKRVKGEKK